MSEPDDHIVVVYPVTGVQDEALRGFREVTQQAARVAFEFPKETLVSSFETFIKAIGGLLRSVPEGPSGYRIEEIELSAEISGEGKLQLIGGVTAGMKGGITFKLRRDPALAGGHA
jgi:hypothetical protein